MKFVLIKLDFNFYFIFLKIIIVIKFIVIKFILIKFILMKFIFIKLNVRIIF